MLRSEGQGGWKSVPVKECLAPQGGKGFSVWKMLRKLAEVPMLSWSLFLSTMGVSRCNPLNRTRSVGWFRVERIALPQQRCRKAR